jgi:hypothetical protein
MASVNMNTEYFSGSQASIFIGDIWVDEITDFQYSVGANATPIYGYGNTFFSHVAQGRVLVQGSFTINFKEPNYLFAILERYKKYLVFPEIEKRKDRSSYREGDLEEQEESPYAEASSLAELNYLDKRTALDAFFNKGEVTTEASKFLKNRTLSTLDPRLVNDFAVPLFDIKIGYGTTFDEDTIGQQIVGVKLVGRGKTIMANGEAIKESYSFFAQNLV